MIQRCFDIKIGINEINLYEIKTSHNLNKDFRKLICINKTYKIDNIALF